MLIQDEPSASFTVHTVILAEFGALLQVFEFASKRRFNELRFFCFWLLACEYRRLRCPKCPTLCGKRNTSFGGRR
jgi:hypothetical protein